MKREDIIRNSYVRSGITTHEGQTIRLSRGKAEVIDTPKPAGRTYYTLAIQENLGEKFQPQFGDYNRGVVVAEVNAYLEQGYKPRHVWILESGDSQAEIDAMLAKFNAGHRNVWK